MQGSQTSHSKTRMLHGAAAQELYGILFMILKKICDGLDI
jgi:hypothetical protein